VTATLSQIVNYVAEEPFFEARLLSSQALEETLLGRFQSAISSSTRANDLALRTVSVFELTSADSLLLGEIGLKVQSQQAFYRLGDKTTKTCVTAWEDGSLPENQLGMIAGCTYIEDPDVFPNPSITAPFPYVIRGGFKQCNVTIPTPTPCSAMSTLLSLDHRVAAEAILPHFEKYWPNCARIPEMLRDISASKYNSIEELFLNIGKSTESRSAVKFSLLHEKHFEACNPQICTVRETRVHTKMEILTAAFGLLGGLWTVAKPVFAAMVAAWRALFRKPAPAEESDERL
jgi:hypothetical protein